MGLYYYNKEKYDKAINYLLMGVELKDTTIINNLGICYYYPKNDKESGVKYWEMSVELGNYYCANRLGSHYMNNDDYENGEKYYLMDIEKNENIETYNIIACYYYNIKHDNENALKYFFMGVEKNDHNSMINLGIYYRTMGEYENARAYFLMAIEDNSAKYHMGICYKMEGDYEKMEEYFLMAIKDGCTDSIKKLTDHYKCRGMNLKLLKLYINNSSKRCKIIGRFNVIANCILLPDEKNEFLNLLTNFEFTADDALSSGLELLVTMLNDKLTLLDLHFKYTVRGKGYQEAKEDFYERCSGL
jgi:hypothetical protein